MEPRSMKRVRFATYNVLADANVQPEYFPHCGSGVLDARERYPRIVRCVACLPADIICLQEVDHALFRSLVDALGPLGFRGRWAHKDGAKTDGVATFARAPWFWREARIISLGDPTNPEGSGHVALVTTLAGPDRHLTVTNVHLKWDEPDRKGTESAAYTQAQRLLAALSPPFGRAGDVVCGDLNAEPDSAVLALFRADGFVDGQPRDALTCFESGRMCKIDYILARGRMSAPMFMTPEPPPPMALQAPIPTIMEPSDHIPVQTIVEF